MKDKFLEIKKNYEQNKKKLIFQNIKRDKDTNINTSINTSQSANYVNVINNSTNLELNDNVKKIIKNLLLELKKIYNACLNSAIDIEKVFRSPIIHLTCDKDKFNFEDMHREEFSNTIIQDEFIKV